MFLLSHFYVWKFLSSWISMCQWCWCSPTRHTTSTWSPLAWPQAHKPPSYTPGKNRTSQQTTSSTCTVSDAHSNVALEDKCQRLRQEWVSWFPAPFSGLWRKGQCWQSCGGCWSFVLLHSEHCRIACQGHGRYRFVCDYPLMECISSHQ